MEEQQSIDTEAKETNEEERVEVGGFRIYAVENPFNGEIVTKRFRYPDEPVGVVFVQYLEGTIERAKYAEFEDGSSVWTWSTIMKRLESQARSIEAGGYKFLDKGDVRIQLNVLKTDAEVPARRKPGRAVSTGRKPSEKKPKEAKLKEEKSEGIESLPLKGLLPEEGIEVSSYEEDGSIKKEYRTFSSKKAAVDYAKTLESDVPKESIKKVDGSWVVEDT